MNRIIQSLLPIALFALALIPQIASATPITFPIVPVVYEVPGGTHGYSALAPNGDNISYGTQNGLPGKLVNGIWTPLAVPAGYASFSAGHPSANGSYGVFSAVCGGQPCSVVYGAGNPQLFPGLDLLSVGNAGDLAGANNNGQPVRLSLSNRTPQVLSAGSFAGATIAQQSNSGISVGGVFSSDGFSGKAAIWDAFGNFSVLPSLTDQAGAFAMSDLATYAFGFDGQYAALWDLTTLILSYIPTENGSFQTGAALSGLNGGAASGNGWVYVPGIGISVPTCVFFGNPSSISACQPGGPGISRTTLAESGSDGSVGFQASRGQVPFQLTRLYGDAAVNNVPEPLTFLPVLLALLGIGLLSQFRFRRAD